MKSKVQLIEHEVPDAGARVQISEDLDLRHEYLAGIAVPLHVGRGCILDSSTVEGNEILPSGFEVEFLQSELSVSPDCRFFTLPCPHPRAAGRKIKLDFRDGGNADGYPYTLRVYLLLETEGP